jgi:hypothetical protein
MRDGKPVLVGVAEEVYIMSDILNIKRAVDRRNFSILNGGPGSGPHKGTSAQIKSSKMTREEARGHVEGLAGELSKDRQGDFHKNLEALGPENRKGIVDALKLKTDRNLPFKAGSPLLEKHGAAIASEASRIHNFSML